MKSLLIFLCLVISLHACSQDSLVSICAKRLCEYVHGSSAPKDEGPFLGYFNDLIKGNASLVASGAIKLFHDSSGKRNDEFIDIVKRRTIIKLIESCDTFYVFFDSLRYLEMKQLSHEELEREVRRTTRTPNGAFYTRRALYYFAMGQLDTALMDMDMALSLGSNPRAYFFKGWIMEAKGDYKAALDLYTRSLRESGEEDDALYIALVKKKMKEDRGGFTTHAEVPDSDFKTQKGKKKIKKGQGFAVETKE